MFNFFIFKTHKTLTVSNIYGKTFQKLFGRINLVVCSIKTMHCWDQQYCLQARPRTN